MGGVAQRTKVTSYPKRYSAVNALIDTADFLWLASGDARLSEARRGFVADSGNEIFLSAISVMEIAIKHALGKLILPSDPALYIPAIRTSHRISPLPLYEAVPFCLTSLPPIHHDPFDRILICQALVHGLLFVTSDPVIHRYSVRHL